MSALLPLNLKWKIFQNETLRPYLGYNRHLLSQHLLIGGYSLLRIAGTDRFVEAMAEHAGMLRK